jgi:hypothetical protein
MVVPMLQQQNRAFSLPPNAEIRLRSVQKIRNPLNIASTDRMVLFGGDWVNDRWAQSNLR